MVRRAIPVAVGVLAVAALLEGCAAGHASSGSAVEAYVEPGEHGLARVDDAAGRATTIGVDGVTVTDDGTGLNPSPDGLAELADAAASGGAVPELLVSNYSESVGDFSPEVGTALLGDPAHRHAVARDLATEAHHLHMRGIQIDLESLRTRDRAGLVAFAAEVERAVHDRLGDGAEVSMAIMASTDADGFRSAGYDLRGLSDHVDRFVLMTYDEHGPWGGPGPIGGLSWAERVVRAAERLGVPADRIDLGVAGYGRVWDADGTGEDRVLTAAGARRLAGDHARWSTRDAEWSAGLPDGRVVHWSDARSFRARVDAASRLGLHGVAMWSLGLQALPDT